MLCAKNKTKSSFTLLFFLSHLTTLLYRFLVFSLLYSSNVASSFSLLSVLGSIMTSNTNNINIDTIINKLPLDSLATTANSYASAHGIQVEKKHATTQNAPAKSYFECAPISLLPNAYPRAAFIRAQAVSTSFNTLVNSIAHDSIFLQNTLGGQVSKADPFTKQLLDLYNEIYINPKTCNTFAINAHCLGIFRSDYMLHSFMDDSTNTPVVDIKQVELNTIAASFAGLSTRVADLHRYLLSRFQFQQNQNENDDTESDGLQEFLNQNKQAVYKNSTTTTDDQGDNTSLLCDKDGVPINTALEKLAHVMYIAVQQYQECHKTKKQLAVLFVVQDGESNTVDQRLLEFQLFQQYQIPVIRQSLTKLYDTAKVNATTGALTVDGQYEIALIYYRAGYAPTDYPNGYLFDNNNDSGSDDNVVGFEWKARKRMEMSRATKCPSLGYHLAGTKKVQQALARPGVLEQFVQNKQQATAMRRVFAGLYSTSQQDMVEADYQAVADVVINKNHDLYVLKPQREGGGYNFYGEKLAEKLMNNVQIIDNNDDDSNDKSKKSKLILNDILGEYILMQRLFPPQQNAILLRSGQVEGIGKCISELGIFGTILCGPTTTSKSSSSSSSDTTTTTSTTTTSSNYSNQNVTILHNEYAGFLLRTKFSHVDEGGVASGFATLSSPYLC